MAQSPTEKKQGETITLQDTKNKHPLNENNFCGSGYPQFFVRDIEPNLSHARRGEGGRKWDFRWDVGTNNPTIHRHHNSPKTAHPGGFHMQGHPAAAWGIFPLQEPPKRRALASEDSRSYAPGRLGPMRKTPLIPKYQRPP